MLYKLKMKLYSFKNRKAVIFGTSFEGRLACSILNFHNVRPAAFIDNAKHKRGMLTYGVEIMPPQALKDMENYIVIVPSVYYGPMTQQLKEMGIPSNIVFNIDIYDKAALRFDAPYKLKFYLWLNKRERKENQVSNREET